MISILSTLVQNTDYITLFILTLTAILIIVNNINITISAHFKKCKIKIRLNKKR